VVCHRDSKARRKMRNEETAAKEYRKTGTKAIKQDIKRHKTKETEMKDLFSFYGNKTP
jgi:hypothetical protein